MSKLWQDHSVTVTDCAEPATTDAVNASPSSRSAGGLSGAEHAGIVNGSNSPLPAKLSATSSIPVLEIFGPTVQGEGMVIGQKTMFVRTAGCDYRCSWCDSAFTWDGSAKGQIRKLSAEQIWSELKAIGGDRFGHVTISGGNPALLGSLGELVRLLRANGIRTAVETQGSRWQDWLLGIDDVTISPKPPSSGMPTDFAILDDMIQRLSRGSVESMKQQIMLADDNKPSNEQQAIHQQVSLKIVIFDEADLDYAEQVHLRYPSLPFYIQTGNPDVLREEDDIAASLLRRYEWLIDQAMERRSFNDARILPQLHTLVWGNKRGV